MVIGEVEEERLVCEWAWRRAEKGVEEESMGWNRGGEEQAHLGRTAYPSLSSSL